MGNRYPAADQLQTTSAMAVGGSPKAATVILFYPPRFTPLVFALAKSACSSGFITPLASFFNRITQLAQEGEFTEL